MKFEVYRTAPLIRRPEWRWRLKSPNGRIIATSGEGYRNLIDCRNSLSLVLDTSRHTPLEISGVPVNG